MFRNPSLMCEDIASPRAFSLIEHIHQKYLFQQTYVAHIGSYSIYDGDKMLIRLAYDTTISFVSNGTSHSEDTITIRSRHDDLIRQ